jgi:ABC-2 type transport system permease protein
MNLAIRRTAGLTWANALLLVRNRTTLGYALIVPLLPMGFLFTAERVDIDRGMITATACLLMALLFPVYYNLLSVLVTRRDELVLKRLRTGETRDHELLLSMVIPGVAVTLAVSAVLLAVGMSLGLPVPANPVLFVLVVLAGCAVFAALAVWTAAWTQNAEAAQITSMPVIALTTVGMMKQAFPRDWHQLVDLTPGAALLNLVRTSWSGQGPHGPVDFVTSWSAAGRPLLALAAWMALAAWLAKRSLRWEPRT